MSEVLGLGLAVYQYVIQVGADQAVDECPEDIVADFMNAAGAFHSLKS